MKTAINKKQKNHKYAINRAQEKRKELQKQKKPKTRFPKPIKAKHTQKKPKKN